MFPYMKPAFLYHPPYQPLPIPANPIYIVNSASFPTATSPPEVLSVTKCTRNNEATLRDTNGNSLRQIQADLSVAIHLTNQASVITQLRESNDPRSIQHLAHFMSQCHDIYTWSTTPTCPQTTLTNDQCRVGISKRLLIPIIKLIKSISELICPICNVAGQEVPRGMLPGGCTDIDAHGNHSYRCKFDQRARTALHDAIKMVYHRCFRHAGYISRLEPYGTLEGSNKRPDIILTDSDSSVQTFLDIRTCALTKDIVVRCGQTAGLAASHGADLKDRAWLEKVHLQGDQFIPLCHEHPGLIGDEALALIHRASKRFSSSPPAQGGFRTYWLRRLHMANTRGTAEIILRPFFCI